MMDMHAAKKLFDELVDLPFDQQQSHLEKVKDQDPDLHALVRELLANADTLVVTPDVQVSPTDRSQSLSPKVPESIAGYRIQRQIGFGGMGVVYRAIQQRTNQVVALKVVRPDRAGPDAVKRFERESAYLGRLKHPGIAQVYEAGSYPTSSGDAPYIVMEYIQGRPLDQYAKALQLTLEERVQLLIKVIDAVQYAHAKAVIHRDLKPANILVTDDGEPKILDFGIARALHLEPADTQNTNVGQLLGTLPYMSPEQVAADPDELDVRSDVYALGVIAYELLAEKLPYDVISVARHEALRTIVEAEPAPLSTVHRAFKGDVETIILHALEKEPARRYQSASEFAGDLHRFLKDEPITARPASAIYKIKKFAKRHKPMFIAGILMIAGFATGVIGLSWGLVIQNTARIQAETERDNAARAQAEAEAARDGERAAKEVSEDRLEQVQSLLDVMKSAELELDRMEGGTRAKELFILAQLNVLEDQYDAVGDQPELVRDLADAQLRAARATLEVGDSPRLAVQTAKSAVEFLQKTYPQTPSVGLDVVQAYRLLAEAHVRVGNAEAALMAVERAETELDTIERSRNAEFTPRERQTARADLFRQRAGVSRLVEGMRSQAAGHYESCLEIWRELLDRDRTSTTVRLGLARALTGAGELALSEERAEAAVERLDESVALLRALRLEEPNDHLVTRSYIQALQYLEPAIRLTSGDNWPEQSLKVVQSRVEEAERYHAADPASGRALSTLTGAYEALGEHYLRLDPPNVEQAQRGLERFYALAKAAHDRAPGDLYRRRALAIAKEELATLALKRADLDPDAELALEAREKAWNQIRDAALDYEALARIDDVNPLFREDAARAYSRLSQSLLQCFQADGTNATAERRALFDESTIGAARATLGLYRSGSLPSSDEDILARRLRNGARRLAPEGSTKSQAETAVEWFELADEVEPRAEARLRQHRAELYFRAGMIDDAIATTLDGIRIAESAIDAGERVSHNQEYLIRLREDLDKYQNGG